MKPIKLVRAIIVAGGIGSRLNLLTKNRPKPNLPVEKRRLIDFTLSNALYSTLIDGIEVLVQAYANKVLRHVEETCLIHRVQKPVRCQVVPMRTGLEHFAGDADALRKSEYLFDGRSDDFLILGADHLYVMDYNEFITIHHERQAAVSVMVKRVPTSAAAKQLGVFTVGPDGEVIGFDEKPLNPAPIPGSDDCLASMGIYMFDTAQLQQLLAECSGNGFGHDIIPRALKTSRLVTAYEYDGYWRDLGTVQSYWQACMDLVSPLPSLNLYNPQWPIIHRPRHFASPKFITGCAVRDAIISDGSIIAGEVYSSVLGTGVRVNEGAVVIESVLFDGAEIGCGARLRRVIVDKKVKIGSGIALGFDPEGDARRYPQIGLEGDIIVIPRDSVLTA